MQLNKRLKHMKTKTMSEQKHTPIQEWIKGESYNWYKQAMFNSNHIADIVSYIDGVKAVLNHIGLSDIENPAEWVRILKEERVESRVSYWKEKAENSDWRYKELQSENERLKAEIEDLKRYKQAMIDGSNTDISLLWEGEGDKPKKVLYEEEIAALKAELAKLKGE